VSAFEDELSDGLAGGVPRSEVVGAVPLVVVLLLGAGSVVAEPAGLVTVLLRVAVDEFVSAMLARGLLTELLFVSVEAAVSD